MPDHPKTLLIILNHNSLQKLGTDTTKFLQSILSTDYPNLNIVIIDNASTDHSDTLISTEVEKNGKGKLVRLETNMGYAGGNNYGFRNFGHDSKYVVFINNDVEVEPDWLTKIIDVMEKDETIAAAQPKILQIKDRKRIDSLGGIVDELGRAYDIGHGMINRIDVSQPYQVFYARGAAIVIRKKSSKNWEDLTKTTSSTMKKQTSAGEQGSSDTR